MREHLLVRTHPGPGRRSALLALLALPALLLAACGTAPAAGEGTPGGAAAPAQTATTTATTATTAAGTRLQPYVDASLVPSPLPAMADASGVTDAVLGFVLAGPGGCTPTWGGTQPVTAPAVVAAARDLTGRGGAVAVATGGATGSYLESACPDAPSLARAYGEALDAVGSTALVVDVEEDVPVATVVEALRTVQDERHATVTLTLKVDDAERGLTAAAVDLVRAADAAGVDAHVDAMVMNFPYTGSWADAMTGATDTVLDQLGEVWSRADEASVAARTGVVFMLGRTDLGAVTTLDDAGAVVRDARERGLGTVGFWSVGRDNGGCPDRPTASYDCSGIAQSPFAFTLAARDAAAASPEEGPR
ncbi:carbohydrate-binding protein CenC [Pseudonocardia kujensis]|uniref:carbohydrate-binding protein CenC n=1 Tax=Pseudonocardia kujensis TaxID=1128675 RepID=UPI001E36AF26|nr:carbohydrate-binding protein CenC [Pseudonocardia kujensis]MCE0768417.1 carbohydrate-binding protein CenC [Pseudonocardia kujensis]